MRFTAPGRPGQPPGRECKLTDEVAVPENATEERQSSLAGLYDPDRDFRKLALESHYFSKGFRLVDKEALIGIPFVIIGITYREGFPRGESKKPGDYVSVECVVADKDTMNSPVVRSQIPDPNNVTVYPNESVVFNDSGTGVRRTLTALLSDMGIVDVGTVKKDENGYDKPFQSWADGAERATTGVIADPDGEKFRYVAMRGLRKSDYESPYGPATTFYIS